MPTLNVIATNSFRSVLKAPADLRLFSHLRRKNDAFAEVSHQRDSSLPREFSFAPRDSLPAAGHFHVLQVASRYVLAAGCCQTLPAPVGGTRARPCHRVSPALPCGDTAGQLPLGLALLTRRNLRVAATLPVLR